MGPGVSGAFGAHTPTLVKAFVEDVGISMGSLTNLVII